LGIALWLNLPAQAAVVLEYFNAIPSSSAVLLEWSTASEYNVAGFELFCKGVDEPRSAYHRLGFLNAKGGPDQGAQYDLLVTDLAPGQAYCFRLEEVTTDNTPGEVRERCGYGLGIGPTPIPSPTATFTQTVALTPTVVLFPTQALGVDGAVPTATSPGAFITSTPGASQPQSPLAEPTPTWTIDPAQQGLAPTADAAAANGTPNPFANPLAGQLPTIDPLNPGAPSPDPLNQQFPATPTPNPLFTGQVSTVDPLLTGTQAAQPGAQAQQGQSPLETPTPTWTPSTPVTQSMGIDDGIAGAPPGSQPADPARDLALVPTATIPGPPPATATSLYVVVTAAATPEPQGIAPGLTPWPTATPPTAFQFTNLLTPSAQNLTVLLLCFIFMSATGLGLLGLLTSVVYMRSRARREYEELRVRSRRRLL
jgi:hypothetical protein